MLCNVVLCNVMQCNAMQRNAMLCNVMYILYLWNKIDVIGVLFKVMLRVSVLPMRWLMLGFS